MVERIRCKNPGCSNMILPETARRTDGFCMPCVQAAARKEREEYIRKNRKDVNEFEGITDPVELLKIIHKERPYDQLVNWIPHPTPTDQLYRELDERQTIRLADYAESLIGTDKDEEAESILLCLAAFTNVQLDSCLDRLVSMNTFWPSLAFCRASSTIRDRLMDRVDQDDENRNHILLALSWIGDEAVVELFTRWKNRSPFWSKSLYVPPQDYAREAGWELTEAGEKRYLYFDQCTKLIKSPTTDPDRFQAITGSTERCPWCRRHLTNLITLTPSTFGIVTPTMPTHIQVTTCENCTAFGAVFGEFDENGGHWSASNSRPEYLPDNSDDWEKLPKNSLCIADSRPALFAANQFLPTTFSQIGGHPTWIQDSCYPSCPSCTKTMMFLAQIDKDDIYDCGEGFYYAFICPDCKTTATAYQQT